MQIISLGHRLETAEMSSNFLFVAVSTFVYTRAVWPAFFPAS